MALVKHTDRPAIPGSWLSDFFDDDWFGSSISGRRNMPAVNIRENDKSFEIELATPGFDKKDFSVLVDNNVLTVSAEKKEEKEQTEDHYTRREFGYQSFSRSFTLPTNTNEEEITARYEDGILKLSIAKKTQPEGNIKKPITVK